MSGLEDVMVGDLLIEKGQGGRRVIKVKKITPTQIVAHTNERYQRKNGRKIGCDDFYIKYVTIPKDGEVDSIRRYNLIEYVCRSGVKMLDATKISYEQALKIKDILNL